jgi:hypothetical protein
MGLEQVPCIEFYSSLEKQFPILLLERGLAVMPFLSLDVFDQVIDVAPGARKGGVSLRPVRKAFEDGVLFDPERRAGLNLLHEIRQADRRMQAAKNVKVIFHSIDTVKMAVSVLDDAPYVAEEVISALARENVRAVFGGKHDVVRDGGAG